MRTIVALTVACLFAGLSIAGESDASIKKYDLNIPRQSLDAALKDFAQQTGLQIARMGNAGKGTEMVGPVSGSLTPQQALDDLLSTQGLSYKVVNETTIAIVKPGAETADNQGGDGTTLNELSPGASTADMRLAQSNAAEESKNANSAAANSAQSSAEDSESKGIQEIVVTAQKREEKMSDVPLSISTVLGEDLVKRNITDTLSLSYNVPSLGAYQVGPGQNLLSLRGISNSRGGSTLVGLYLDEISVTGGMRLVNGSGLNVQAIDLARVEVLKGPQGTLFGEGAMGGVIRYVTNDPKLDGVEGRVMASYFNTQDGDGSMHASGVLNLPVVDGVLGVRIVASYENDGGWIENIGTGEDNYNASEMTDVRVKVLYTPTEELRVSLLAEINRLDADGTNIVNVPPFAQGQFRQAVFPDARTDVYDYFNIYNLTASYDFGFATLLSSTSHYDLDSGGQGRTQIAFEQNPADILGAYIEPTQSVTSQEFRLTSNAAGPFKWLVGANYKKTENEFDLREGFTNTFGGTVNFGVAAGLYGTSASKILTGFTDASYTFFDRLEIGGGLRRYQEDLSNRNFQRPIGLVAAQDGTFKKTSYRAFVKYQLTESLNLYANTATGFRSGGFNNQLAVDLGRPNTVGPEESEFHEVGIKGSFFENRITLDLAAFQGKFKDQIQNISEFVGTTPIQYSVNAGVTDIGGFEWALNVIPVTGLRLGLSGDITDTKYSSVTPLAAVIVGDPIDFVPDYSVIATADYVFNWSAGVPGYVNVSSSWKGAMQYTNRNTGLGPVIDRNSMVQFVQASVGAEWKGFEFSLFGRNLLNERDRLTPQFTGWWPQARPRTFGISVGKNF